MSLNLKKISGNQLFTPTILLLAIILGFYTSSIDLVEKTYNFSFIIAISSTILILKTFTAVFGNIEDNLKNKKNLLPASLLVLALIQFYLGFLAIDFLTVDKFPLNSVGIILTAEIIFAITAFLTKNTSVLKFSLVIILILSVATSSLYFKWFDRNIDLFILSQQFIAYIILIFQLIELFLCMSFYGKHKSNS